MVPLRSGLAPAFLISLSPALGASPSAPPMAVNDECGTAIDLSVGATAFDSSTATPSTSNWNCNGSGADVWFTYTSVGSSSITIDTLGSSFDTVMMVWSGTCAAAVYLGCNDDVQSGVTQSLYTIAGPAAGDTFLVRIGGYNGATGTGSVNVAQAQPIANPTGLMISEYVDGKNANDAVEIYNGTAHTVDLSDYLLRVYYGNSQNANASATLSGMLGPRETAVFVRSSGNSNSITGNLSARGVPYTLLAPSFTPDDTLELCDSSYNSIDIIGEIGNDPGFFWGSGSTTTNEDTLRRKSPVERGQVSGAFDPAIEFDGYPRDTFSGLGNHAGPVAVFVDCDVTTNSGGTPATLYANGSRAVADNNLSLTVSGLPPTGTTAYIFNSFLSSGQSLSTVANPAPGGGPASGGDVCIAGGTFGRHVFGSDVYIGTAGTFTISVDLTDVPSPRDGISFPNPGHYSTTVLTGETWFWQCWYRDQSAGTGASNFSEAIAITFE